MVADADYEIHRRSVLWKYKFEYGVEWEARNMYYNVATGASITGFTRAYLLRAAHSVGMHNVIYCDTDSLILREEADISSLPQTDKLGDWELEEACAPVGYFAGKKMYGIKLANGKEKMATKGASGAGFELMEGAAMVANYGGKMNISHIKRMVEGETIKWSPSAPTFSLANGINFVPRKIRATGA